MNPTNSQRISHLLKLADVAQEFEFVDLKLVNHFSYLREEFGLAKLLLLIEEHVRTKSQPKTETFETSNTNQNQDVVQRL